MYFRRPIPQSLALLQFPLLLLHFIPAPEAGGDPVKMLVPGKVPPPRQMPCRVSGQWNAGAPQMPCRVPPSGMPGLRRVAGLPASVLPVFPRAVQIQRRLLTPLLAEAAGEIGQI